LLLEKRQRAELFSRFGK